jgi:hypothetical protein
MPFDEEDLDPHGECAARIHKLERALRLLVPTKMPDGSDELPVQMWYPLGSLRTAKEALEQNL